MHEYNDGTKAQLSILDFKGEPIPKKSAKFRLKKHVSSCRLLNTKNNIEEAKVELKLCYVIFTELKRCYYHVCCS